MKHTLIQLLADGEFHSGEKLGRHLQMTRSGVWKIIHQLSDLGIEIHRIKGKGYQIPNGLELLDREKILSHLPSNVGHQVQLEILPEVNSTNQYLLDERNRKAKGTIVFAEHQTDGRGRRQRKWISPYGYNLYCSFLWDFDKDPTELGGLSLAVAVAVANTLERYGISTIQLKWPNDILWNYKKISGILIEMCAETNSHTQVVIGIGLNLFMPLNIAIDQAWTDVATIIGHKPDRNLIATYLIEEVIVMLDLFQKKGFRAFFKYWQALDAYFNKPVTITTPQRIFHGIAKGINRQGELLLLDSNNKELHFLHGEVIDRR